MFDSDLEYEMYKESAREENLLKLEIANNKDVIAVILYLFNNNIDFIKLQEPYRTDRKERFLKWFNVEENDISNIDINQSIINLSKDFTISKNIKRVFGFNCCIINDADIFNELIYGQNYKNLVKYQT